MSSASSATAALRTPTVAQLKTLITADNDVKLAVDGNQATGETIVCLVRGCSATSGQAAVQSLSAGKLAPNPNSARPTNQQAVSQVGGTQSGAPQQKLPEFTAVAGNSDAWAKRGGWLFVRIKAKYLLRGDVGQSGWVCGQDAPLESAFFSPHPNPVGMNIPNAD